MPPTCKLPEAASNKEWGARDPIQYSRVNRYLQHVKSNYLQSCKAFALSPLIRHDKPVNHLL
jgi:hypothetical protein